MNSAKIKSTTLLLLLASCASTASSGEAPQGAAAELPGAGEEMMTMPEPTPEHARVLEGVGRWKGTLTSWEAGPEPVQVEATQVVEAVGGFWTVCTMTCDFMGMPYMGNGHVGYDPDRGLFVGDWVDNMSAAFAWMEGNYLEDGETLRMRWKAPDWMTGELVDHWSDTIQSATTQTSTFYRGTEGGEHQKVMEITMTRADG
jgi:hypothetical protein